MAVLWLTPGDDVAVLGPGGNLVQGRVADLGVGDSITALAGTSDTLRFTTAGSIGLVAGGNGGGLLGFERIELAAGASTLVISAAFAAASHAGTASAGWLSVVSGGDDSIDARALGANERVQVLAGDGTDTILGGAGSDVARFAAAQLTSADLVDLGAGSLDRLQFDTAGALAAGALANVRGVEVVVLAAGGNALALDDAMVASAQGRVVALFDNGGDDVVDAAAVLGGRVTFNMAGGTDLFLGGAGDDRVNVLPGDLTAADRLEGGAGLDVLTLTGAGALAADALAQVTGFERLQFSALGNAATITAGLAAVPGGLAVLGGAGDDSVDATQAAERVGFNPGAGTDTFLGGAGDDQINIRIEDLAGSDRLDGGGGRDRIGLLTAGTITAAMLSGLSSIETLSLSSAAPNVVTLGTNLTDVNVAGGSANDTVTLALSTQYASLGEGDDTLIVTAATMPAISSYGGAGQDTIRIEGGGIATLGAGVRDFETVVLTQSTVLFASGYLDPLAIIGSLGADQVLAGTGLVSLDGNDGNDFLIASFATAATVLGGAGDDVIAGSSGADSLDGGIGTDTLRLLLASTADLEAGTAYANAAPGVTDTLAGFENVTGSLGSDSLFGDASVNRLEGSDGDDLLEGRAGADILDGGAGNDTIVYNEATHGSDTVLGFTAGGTDDALMFNTPAFLLHAGANWGDAVVALDDGTSALPADTVVLAVTGTALDSAAAVDAYLAGRLPVAGGLLVLAQAGPAQAVTLWYDARADVVGGAGTPLLLASFNGVAGPGSFTSDDFLGVA